MEPEEESIVARTRRTIKSLPDPYGHGFARNEDPLERTREAWEKSERFRMKSGRIANNTFFLAFRNIVGFGIATTAVLLVIDSSILPYTSPLFILAIWLIPVLAAFTPPIAGSEATWSAVEAKISLREQGGFGDGKDTPSVRNQGWTESSKACAMVEDKTTSVHFWRQHR